MGRTQLAGGGQLLFIQFSGMFHFALTAKSQICMFILPSVNSTTAYSPGRKGCFGQILYSPPGVICFWKTSTVDRSSTTSLVIGTVVSSSTTRTVPFGVNLMI